MALRLKTGSHYAIHITQTKPAFSWKATGWALLYFWFFSTLLQAIIYLTGYSGTNGLRDSLLYSSLWLIPVFLFPCRIRVIAAVIGVVLWAASLAALSYYVIYGQEFSQSVLFVMFETNANEASEYLSQYFSLKIVLVALAYTVAAILLWTRLRPVYIPSPRALSGVVCPAVRADPPSHRDEYLYQA